MLLLANSLVLSLVSSNKAGSLTGGQPHMFAAAEQSQASLAPLQLRV